MLNLYKEKIFYPRLNRSLGQKKVQNLRRQVLAAANGEVLELGLGSGLNLPCYPTSIQTITAIEPVPLVFDLTHFPIQVRILPMSAEAMEFPDASFDTVVSTFTLCSIPNPEAALCEIHRVLKPGGKFLFLEHGKSPNRWIAGLQNLANPIYNVLACGCNVNRDMVRLITNSGLGLQSVQTAQFPSPISGLYFSGIATKGESLCC